MGKRARMKTDLVTAGMKGSPCFLFCPVEADTDTVFPSRPDSKFQEAEYGCGQGCWRPALTLAFVHVRD